MFNKHSAVHFSNSSKDSNYHLQICIDLYLNLESACDDSKSDYRRRLKVAAVTGFLYFFHFICIGELPDNIFAYF